MRQFFKALAALDKASTLLTRIPSSDIAKHRQTITTLRERIEAEQKEHSTRIINEQKLTATQIRARADAYAKRNTNFIHLLSRDIIMSICEAGLKKDDYFALTMAMVCRSWREAVISQPGLWKRLSLGKKKPVQKTETWLDRSKGRVVELVFESDFDESKELEVVKLLIPCVENVKILRVKCDLPCYRLWECQFKQLETLAVYTRMNRLQEPSARRVDRLDFSLCHPASATLKNLYLEDVTIDFRSDVANPVSAGQHGYLSSLSFLHLKNCAVGVDDVSGSAIGLFRNLPQVEEAIVEGVTWLSDPAERSHSGAKIRPLEMNNLKRFSETGREALSFNHHVLAPNLEEYGLWSHLSAIGPLHKVLAPGLAAALPRLRALDVGKSAIDQNSLLEALQRLSSLQFLNVAYTDIKNDFLNAISHHDGLNPEDQLAPQLYALSIAGNPSITPGAVRDFVNSRLPKDERLVVSKPKMETQAKSASAFRPTVKSRPRQSVSNAAPDQSTNSTSQLTQTLSTPDINSSFFASQSNQPGQTRPRIRWLNMDACDRIDDDLVELLKLKVHFVSAWLGTPVTERIRGMGKWRWDAGWFEE